jgi:hypothetical protein
VIEDEAGKIRVTLPVRAAEELKKYWPSLQT